MSAMSIEIEPAILSAEEGQEIYARLIDTLPASMHSVIKLRSIDLPQTHKAGKFPHPGAAWIAAVERLAETSRPVQGWELQRPAA